MLKESKSQTPNTWILPSFSEKLSGIKTSENDTLYNLIHSCVFSGGSVAETCVNVIIRVVADSCRILWVVGV